MHIAMAIGNPVAIKATKPPSRMLFMDSSRSGFRFARALEDAPTLLPVPDRDLNRTEGHHRETQTHEGVDVAHREIDDGHLEVLHPGDQQGGEVRRDRKSV